MSETAVISAVDSNICRILDGRPTPARVIVALREYVLAQRREAAAEEREAIAKWVGNEAE